MSTQAEARTYLAGEYLVVTQRRGQGIDYYLKVVDPAGCSTEQKVYWMYSMTPFQVAEEAVGKHVGHDAWSRGAATREGRDGGYVVTVD